MRRYVLILMMFALPLQWSWAAAARICQHETAGAVAHLGHHEHVHDHVADQAGAGAQSDAPASYDADCGTCHGQGSFAVLTTAGMPSQRPEALIPTAFLRHMPDHVPDSLLRPPLSRLV